MTATEQSSNPSKVKIHQDKLAQGGLSASEVRAIWGQPADATFGNVADAYFACLDDRITAPSLYTPGGRATGCTLVAYQCLESKPSLTYWLIIGLSRLRRGFGRVRFGPDCLWYSSKRCNYPANPECACRCSPWHSKVLPLH